MTGSILCLALSSSFAVIPSHPNTFALLPCLATFRSTQIEKFSCFVNQTRMVSFAHSQLPLSSYHDLWSISGNWFLVPLCKAS